MPVGPIDALWIGVVPLVVAALSMWILCRFEVRIPAAWTASVTAGLVLGLLTQQVRAGWAAAFAKLIHPHAAIEWLPWLVAIAGAISLFAAFVPRPGRRWVLLLVAAFAMAVPLRLLSNYAGLMARWSGAEKLVILGGWTLAFAAAWVVVSLGRRNGQPLVRSLLLMMVAGSMFVVLAASGSVTLGELAGVAAAALAGTVGVAALLGEVGDGPSHAAGPIVVVLGGLILLGWAYDLAPSNAALLAIALAAATGPLPTDWPASERGKVGVRIALALIPLGLAAASAISTALADQSGYG